MVVAAKWRTILQTDVQMDATKQTTPTHVYVDSKGSFTQNPISGMEEIKPNKKKQLSLPVQLFTCFYAF